MLFEKSEPSALEYARARSPVLTRQASPFSGRLVDRSQVVRVAQYAGSSMCQMTAAAYAGSHDGEHLPDLILEQPKGWRLMVGEYLANVDAVQGAGISENAWLLMIRMAVKAQIDKQVVRQPGDWQPVAFRLSSAAKWKKLPKGRRPSRKDDVLKRMAGTPQLAESFAQGESVAMDMVQVPHLRFEWVLVDVSRSNWNDPVASQDPNRTSGALNRISKSQDWNDLPRAAKEQWEAAVWILKQYAASNPAQEPEVAPEVLSEREKADIREFHGSGMAAKDVSELLGIDLVLVEQALAD